MQKRNACLAAIPALNSTTTPSIPSGDILTGVLREGAQRLLAQTIEAEADAWIEQHVKHQDAHGRQFVVRNGHHPTRTLVTGVGPVEVSQPRVLDRRVAGRRKVEVAPGQMVTEDVDAEGHPVARFRSSILPPYLRKTKAIEELIPWLYLKGISTGGFVEALQALVGPQAAGLSATTSWFTLLLDCKQRGLTVDPKLATADGALGFWAALPKVYPTTRAQHCWVHKTANVLDKMAKKVQSVAKAKLHETWMAPTREDAQKAFDQFLATYQTKYAEAVECLKKDRDVLLAFYDFPAEHWIHLRTTNPIESTFATVRLRHRRTKGNGSRMACLAMVFKLCESAEKHWRLLNGATLPEVIAGVKFINGENLEKTAA